MRKLTNNYCLINTAYEADKEISEVEEYLKELKSFRSELLKKETGNVYRVIVKLGTKHDVEGTDMFGGRVGASVFDLKQTEIVFETENEKIARDFYKKFHFGYNRIFREKYAPKYTDYMLDLETIKTNRNTDANSTTKKFSTFGRDFYSYMVSRRFEEDKLVCKNGALTFE